MIVTVSDFTIDQLQTFIAVVDCLRPAGLHACVDALDTGEVIAIYRPRNPSEWLWFVSPAEGGQVIVTTLPSGVDRDLPSIEAALNWIATETLTAFARGGCFTGAASPLA